MIVWLLHFREADGGAWAYAFSSPERAKAWLQQYPNDDATHDLDWRPLSSNQNYLVATDRDGTRWHLVAHRLDESGVPPAAQALKGDR